MLALTVRKAISKLYHTTQHWRGNENMNTHLGRSSEFSSVFEMSRINDLASVTKSNHTETGGGGEKILFVR